MLALSFCAKLSGALLGLALGEILNDKTLHIALPAQRDLVSCVRIFASEMVGTFILVFFILRISSSSDRCFNTLRQNEKLSTFVFVAVFVHIGRKFGPSSGCSINLTVIVSTAIMAASKGSYEDLWYCWLWIGGDIAGAIIAVAFFDGVF